MKKGLEIANNGKIIVIKFNFDMKERFRIAKAVFMKGIISFKISGPEYEEINLS